MAALQKPVNPMPQSGQFVFSETRTPSGWISRLWLSADGRQSGLTGNGDVIPNDGARYTGSLSDLPTDRGQVFSYLEQTGLISGGGASNNAIGKTDCVVLAHIYLLVAQRAALYEFLAAIPGFTRVPSAVDAIGREGVGISWALPSRGNTHGDHCRPGDIFVSRSQDAAGSFLQKTN
jgi:hypothetical protein